MLTGPAIGKLKVVITKEYIYFPMNNRNQHHYTNLWKSLMKTHNSTVLALDSKNIELLRKSDLHFKKCIYFGKTSEELPFRLEDFDMVILTMKIPLIFTIISCPEKFSRSGKLWSKTMMRKNYIQRRVIFVFMLREWILEEPKKNCNSFILFWKR